MITDLKDFELYGDDDSPYWAGYGERLILVIPEDFKIGDSLTPFVALKDEVTSGRILAINYEEHTPELTDTCVHTEHCCFNDGCKYGDDDCPVYLGYKKQSHVCEACHDLNDENYVPELPKILKKDVEDRRKFYELMIFDVFD